MISYIRGELVAIEEDKVIVDVNGVGFGIYMPAQSMNMLPQIGEDVKLHTYMNVREDAMNLFGFLSKDELKVFKLLITVNGIGPKGALAILTIMSPNDLRYAIMTEDSKLISKAPGVGAKTAQKVILELKDKLDMDAVVNIIDDDIIKRNNDNVHNEIIEEAVEALVSLGYTQKEITKIIKSCDITECKTTEDVIKLVLKNI